jgi:hypothetical protein
VSQNTDAAQAIPLWRASRLSALLPVITSSKVQFAITLHAIVQPCLEYSKVPAEATADKVGFLTTLLWFCQVRATLR